MKSICFAYFANGEFIGWYADSFGSCRPNSPKIYSDLEQMKPILTRNLTYKLQKINNSSFEEEKDKTKNLGDTIGLFKFDSEELLRGKDIELRAIECPYYDGPNPDFKKEEYENSVTEWLILNRGKLPTKKNGFKGPENWIYADYKLIKEWANTPPVEFIDVIKPIL